MEHLNHFFVAFKKETIGVLPELDNHMLKLAYLGSERKESTILLKDDLLHEICRIKKLRLVVWMLAVLEKYILYPNQRSVQTKSGG